VYINSGAIAELKQRSRKREQERENLQMESKEFYFDDFILFLII
jgi:hypothetical protein